MPSELFPLPSVGGVVSYELLATAPDTTSLNQGELFNSTTRIQDIQLIPGTTDSYAVVDTRGVVWLLEDGVFRDDPIVDVNGAGLGFVPTFGFGENGLRSVAFHPDFAVEGADGQGKVYLVYSADPTARPSDTKVFEFDDSNPDADTPPPIAAIFDEVIAEFDIDVDALAADTSSARELLRIEQPFSNHNFGQLKFNPHAEPDSSDYGQLYFSVGDGGAADDPLNVSQELDQILGKFLRIDPLEGPNGEAYTIPEDNPFVGQGDVLPEILAYGLRNAQQFDFSEDGLIYLNEIGQNAVEEINVYVPGGNYGWDVTEGTFLLDDPMDGNESFVVPLGDDDFGFQYPIAQYFHANANNFLVAVGGGVVYEEGAIDFLNKSFAFPDISSGDLYFVDTTGIKGDINSNGNLDPSETRDAKFMLLVDETGAQTSFGEITGAEIFPGEVRPDLRFAPTSDGGILAFSKATGNIYEIVAPDRMDVTLSGQDDTLDGTMNNDMIDAAGGDDFIFGRKGDDTLIGGEGDDFIKGNHGDDMLIGGEGADTLKGNRGDDVIEAGSGDNARGGGGQDTLIFHTTSEELESLSARELNQLARLYDTGNVNLRNSELDFKARQFEEIEIVVDETNVLDTRSEFEEFIDMF